MFEAPEPDALNADGFEDDVVDVLAEDLVDVGRWVVGAGKVDVTMTTGGGCVGSVVGGV